MTVITIIAGVFLAICFLFSVRRELLPLGAVFFLTTYSFWCEDYLPVFGIGTCEAGYFTLLAFWPCIGAILKQRKIYLIKMLIYYALFFYSVFIFMDWMTDMRIAMVDLMSAICAAVSITVYLFLMNLRKWGFLHHVVSAIAAAVFDLLTYFTLGVIFSYDPLPLAEVPEVYATNLLAIGVLIPFYSLALFLIKEPTSDPKLTIVSESDELASLAKDAVFASKRERE